MWDGTDFSGTKIALLCGDRVVAYLRDDKPGIPFPGLWDLPGGGREGDEPPLACGLREVEEEFGLRLDPAQVAVVQRHPSPSQGLDTYFCAARIDAPLLDAVQFGHEGQRWAMMPTDAFIGHDRAVPHLQRRLAAVLEQGLI